MQFWGFKVNRASKTMLDYIYALSVNIQIRLPAGPSKTEMQPWLRCDSDSQAKKCMEEFNCNAFTFRGRSKCILMVLHSDGCFV